MNVIDSTVNVFAGASGNRDAAPRAALFHPIIDFLALGGGSLLILPALVLVPDDAKPTLGLLSLVLVNIINHPHFAHSYQLFYRDFRNRLFGQKYSGLFFWRYINAGIVIPLVLLVFMAYSFLSDNGRMLGFAANLMFFLVGWHYVKQGYGIFIVDCVMQKNFLNHDEKRVLRYNAYAGWALSYMTVNTVMIDTEFLGLDYYAVEFPDPIVYAAAGVLALTSLRALLVIGKKWQAQRPFPINGLVAYTVSIYLWLLGRFDPLMIFLIPAFHSLQYLLIVWRYEVNSADACDGCSPAKHMILFVLSGMVLGFAGFFAVPLLLDANVDYDSQIFGGSAFMFMFWIFINVHHYFIDNVLWRGENPDTKRFLFAHQAR